MRTNPKKKSPKFPKILISQPRLSIAERKKKAIAEEIPMLQRERKKTGLALRLWRNRL